MGRYRLLHALRTSTLRPFWCRTSSQVGGFEFLCHLQDSISREVCFTGIYEPQETLIIQKILRSGDTFVDVGANWGYHAMLAAQLVGDTGRVVCLEPDPFIAGLLQQNLSRNQFSQVSLHALAASAEPGHIPWNTFDAAGGNWGTGQMLTPSAARDSGQTKVPTVVLDDLLNDLGIDHVDLLKMDIEGGEVFALRGMERGLKSGVYRRILLELHPAIIRSHGAAAESLIQGILSAGYDCWRIDHSSATTRKVAYGRLTAAEDLLLPYEATAALDSWPHLLCVRSGESRLGG